MPISNPPSSAASVPTDLGAVFIEEVGLTVEILGSHFTGGPLGVLADPPEGVDEWGYALIAPTPALASVTNLNMYTAAGISAYEAVPLPIGTAWYVRYAYNATYDEAGGQSELPPVPVWPESGTSGSLPLPDGRTNVGVTVALGDPPGGFPGEWPLVMSGLSSNAGGSGDEDDRFAIVNAGLKLDCPNDAWWIVQVQNLTITNPNTVPMLTLQSDGIVNGQPFVCTPLGSDVYRFDGQVWVAFPADWASGDGVDSFGLKVLNADEDAVVGGNTYVQVTTFSPPVAP